LDILRQNAALPLDVMKVYGSRYSLFEINADYSAGVNPVIEHHKCGIRLHIDILQRCKD
jgi:hypothetical protein